MSAPGSQRRIGPTRRTALAWIIGSLAGFGVVLNACSGPVAGSNGDRPAATPGGQRPAASTSESAATTVPRATRPSSSAPGAALSRVKDFRLVAYQGEEMLGGAETSFSSVFTRGTPVVLNFWAGQCPPCRLEMPAFQKIADEFQGKVIFVGVDVGIFTGLGNRDDARRLVRDLAIRYPAAYAVDPVPLRLYNILAMPTTVFLTAQGEIVEQVNGVVLEDRLRSRIRRLVDGKK